MRSYILLSGNYIKVKFFLSGETEKRGGGEDGGRGGCAPKTSVWKSPSLCPSSSVTAQLSFRSPVSGMLTHIFPLPPRRKARSLQGSPSLRLFSHLCPLGLPSGSPGPPGSHRSLSCLPVDFPKQRHHPQLLTAPAPYLCNLACTGPRGSRRRGKLWKNTFLPEHLLSTDWGAHNPLRVHSGYHSGGPQSKSLALPYPYCLGDSEGTEG